MEFADAMCLVRPPPFDGHGVPVEDREVVHGLVRLRQFAGGDRKRDEPSHGLKPRIDSKLRGVKEFQLSPRTGREGTAASCLYAARLLWAGH